MEDINRQSASKRDMNNAAVCFIDFNALKAPKEDKKTKMKEKLVELKKKEQDRVRRDALRNLEEAKAIINLNTSLPSSQPSLQTSSQAPKSKSAYLTGLKQPTKLGNPVIQIDFNEEKKDEKVEETQQSQVVTRASIAVLRQSQADKVIEKKQVIADYDVVDDKFEQIKKAQIRKLNKEKKKTGLMAMLKTVKRRKAIDLISEAASELKVIDEKYTQQEDLLQLLELKPSISFQMPYSNKVHFNAQKLQEWNQELENLSIPSERKTITHVNHFQVQTQEPQLLKDLLEELDNDETLNLFDSFDQIDNLVAEYDDFSLNPLTKVDKNFHRMTSQEFKELSLINSEDFFQNINSNENSQEMSSRLNAQEEETKEVKKETKKDFNIYVNYDMLGGLEQIVECDEEDAEPEANKSVISPNKKKFKQKQTPAFAKNQEISMNSDTMPSFQLSEEPDMMRITKSRNRDTQNSNSGSLGKSQKKPVNIMSQSLRGPLSLQQLALANDNQISIGKDEKITLKQRSNSFNKARANDLDDDFSCDTSQYSAFDDSEQSSDLIIHDDSNFNDITENSQFSNSNEKPQKNFKPKAVENKVMRSQDLRRTSKLNDEAMIMAAGHQEVGRSLQKAMEQARETMATFDTSTLSKVEDKGLIESSDIFTKHSQRKTFQNQKTFLRSLVTANKIINEQIQEGANVDSIKTSDSIEQIGIEVSSIIPILLVDGDQESRRSTHMHLGQDSFLQKNLTALKLISSNRGGDKFLDWLCLYKLSIVYFMLKNYDQASDYINKACQLCPKTFLPPKKFQLTSLWKGLIFFYYLYNYRKGITSSKNKVEQQKYIQSVVKQCEEALRSVTEASYITTSKFILLKLTLMIRRERFGCDLVYVLAESASDIARSIRDIDQYLGQVARCEVYIEGEEPKQAQAIDLLNDLAKRYPQRIEAYLKLWQIYYSLGNFHEKKSIQTMQQILPAKLDQSKPLQDHATIARGAAAQQDEMFSEEFFVKAVETSEKLLIFCTDITETNEKLALLLIITVKGLFKTGGYIKCFELLQKEFTQNPNQSSLLYFYGKYVVKAMAVETKRMQKKQQEKERKRSGTNNAFGSEVKKRKHQIFRIDKGYLGSGIGALEECLRVCLSERKQKVNFYIGFAYKILNMPLKTFDFWKKADERGQKNKTLSIRQQQQVRLFQNEFSLFSLIGDKATEMIKSASSGNKTKLTFQQQNQVKEYINTMKAIELLDRPNSLLFQAKLQSYLVETSEEPKGFGQAFEHLINEYPTFIDAYLQYWKYLKFRLGQLSGRAEFELDNKTKQVLKERGLMSAAAQVRDFSGQIILEKMHTVAEQALSHSACTEVPTSLCVEARIVYAKQMLYEKNVGSAIKILHEICYILPQLPIEGLSYVDTEQDQFQFRQPNIIEDKDVIEDEDQGFKVQRKLNDKLKPKFTKNISSYLQEKGFASPFKKEVSRDFNQQKEKEDKFKRLQTMLEAREEEVDKIGKTLSALAEGTKNQLNQRAEGQKLQNRRSGQPIQSVNASSRRFKQSLAFQANQSEQAQNFDSLKSSADQLQPLPQNSVYAIKHRSVYNPFVETPEKEKRNSLVSIGAKNRLEQSASSDMVSQSVQNWSPSQLFKSPKNPQNPEITNFENASDQRNQELVRDAMTKVMTTWIRTNQERQMMMDDLGLKDQDEDQNDFDRGSDEEDVYDQTITESENFTVYSNVEFLLLIGKYCAHSSLYQDQGLKALNDYLLILDYQKGLMTKSEYTKLRALSIFHMGTIFYKQKDYNTAMTLLCPIVIELKRDDLKKQCDQAQQKVSKMWKLQFNEQTILKDYFIIDKKTGKPKCLQYNAEK